MDKERHPCLIRYCGAYRDWCREFPLTAEHSCQNFRKQGKSRYPFGCKTAMVRGSSSGDPSMENDSAFFWKTNRGQLEIRMPKQSYRTSFGLAPRQPRTPD